MKTGEQAQRDHSCKGSLTKWLQQLGLDETNNRTQESILVSHMVSRAQLLGANFHCSPRGISRWLDQKQSNALTWDASRVSSGLTCCTPILAPSTILCECPIEDTFSEGRPQASGTAWITKALHGAPRSPGSPGSTSVLS